MYECVCRYIVFDEGIKYPSYIVPKAYPPPPHTHTHTFPLKKSTEGFYAPQVAVHEESAMSGGGMRCGHSGFEEAAHLLLIEMEAA